MIYRDVNRLFFESLHQPNQMVEIAVNKYKLIHRKTYLRFEKIAKKKQWKRDEVIYTGEAADRLCVSVYVFVWVCRPAKSVHLVMNWH